MLPADASRDARDAAARFDAEAADGDVPLPGEWLRIPGLPAGCAARVAKDPKVAVARLPWRKCLSQRPGCEVFLADWGLPGGDNFIQNHFATPFEDERGVHLAYYRDLERSKYRVSVVHALRGDAELVAFGTLAVPDSCKPLKIHASRHGYGMTITISAPPESGLPHQTWAAWSPKEAPTALAVESVTAALGSLYGVQGMAHGDGFMAFEQTAGGGVVGSAFRFSDRTLVTSAPTNTLTSETPIPVNGGYFALVTQAPAFSVGFMPLTGGHRTVVRPLAGSDVQVVLADRKNADALVWTEKERATGITTLYTAPFTTDEATLARRAVARLPFNVGGAVNGGMFAYYFSYQAVRVLRLSDGMGWEIAGETDAPLMGPIWVNDDSIWSVVSSIPEGVPGFPTPGGLLQVARPQGPPTIPNGL